jgi:hypothetical protein
MISVGSFSPNQGLDAHRLAQEFAGAQRIRIADFLAGAAADALLSHLTASSEWQHVIRGEERVFETPSERMDAMPEAERRALDVAIFREAAHGFRFRYDTIRVPDGAEERRRAATPLAGFAQFMASPQMLDFFREVTGRPEIRFVDAQATRYRAGDFLTRHDDRVGGKHRSHAFVLGLTRGWPPEWGGLLLFNEASGGVAEAMAPAFNTMDLFAIGQPHSVSYVAPYAQGSRISIADSELMPPAIPRNSRPGFRTDPAHHSD